jgi:DNA-binding transcriptional LysR family regulator
METIGIETIRLFVKVVQHGGFSKAAEALRIPKSTVSKAVTRLESETGTKLLVRTTRSQTLTAAGRSFYETCLGPIQILEDAQKSLYGQDNIISGTIKITAPEDIGGHVLMPVLSKLSRKYPSLNFDLYLTNEVLDLVKGGYDLAIRIGELRESRLLQRKVGEIIMIPVAAPSYLKDIHKITQPKDMENLAGINLRTGSLSHRWKLRNGKKFVSVNLKPNIQSNQVSTLIVSALAGAGVAVLPKYMVESYLASGKLIQLVPAWIADVFPVSVVSPVSTTSSARLNIISSEIITAIKETLKT